MMVTAMRLKAIAGAAGILALLAAGCSDGEETAADGSTPIVVATTSIWADVVANVACEGSIDIRTLVPAGGDPHRFEPSLADRALLDDAVVVIANGLALEESLLDTLEAVESAGTPVFRVGDHMSTIPYGFSDESHDDESHDAHEDDDHSDHDEHGDHDEDDDHDSHDDGAYDSDGRDEDADHEDHAEAGHDEHDDEDSDHEDYGSQDADHSDHDEQGDHDDDADHEDHAEAGHDEHEQDEADHESHDTDDDHDDRGDHEGHDHSGADPHVWFDPTRVAGVLVELGDQLTNHAGLESAAVQRCVDAYQAQLTALDSEITELTAGVPEENRLLVTNHDALGYFALRYGFEVIGTVIPAPSTLAETNPAQLEELAQVISAHGVRAIFAESQHSDREARALADRVGDVEVVTLLTGTLGTEGSGTDSYLGFMRSNAALITDALA